MWKTIKSKWNADDLLSKKLEYDLFSIRKGQKERSDFIIRGEYKW